MKRDIATGRRPLSSLLAALVAVTGCAKETGILLVVAAPSTMEVASLDFRLAQDHCGRLVQDKDPPKLRVAVAGRDLATSPYRFEITPAQAPTVDQVIAAVVIAHDASGRAVGAVEWSGLRQHAGMVVEYDAKLEPLSGLLTPADEGDCLCGNGLLRLAADGAECGARVFMDPARGSLCTMTPAAAPPSCDGVLMPGETRNRDIPCFVRQAGTCLAGTRRCADHDGHGYAAACSVSAKQTVAPLFGPSPCDVYADGAAIPCDDPARYLGAALGGALVIPLEAPGSVSGTVFSPCDLRVPRVATVAALPFGFDLPPSQVKVGLLQSNGALAVVGPAPPVLRVTPLPTATSSLDVPLLLDNRVATVRLHFVPGVCPAPGDGGPDGSGADAAIADAGTPDAAVDATVSTDGA